MKLVGNQNKNFNDYLIDYFKEKSVPIILKAIGTAQLGLFSRITNDLSTIHPELSHAKIVDQFISAVNFMDDVDTQYRSDVLKRWFFASVNIIAQLFLDNEGRLKNKFLATLVGKKFATIQDVARTLYGEPEDSSRVATISTQIIGSAAVAVTQLLASDQRIIELETYRDRAYGMPKDGIRLQSFFNNLTFDVLKKFLVEDFYLCRLSLTKIFNTALINLCSTLPEQYQVTTLPNDLNGIYDRLIICSPIAGTQDYNDVFNYYLRMLAGYEDELKAKIPELEHEISQFFNHFYECFNDLRDVSDRGERLHILQDTLTQSIETIKDSISIGLKNRYA